MAADLAFWDSSAIVLLVTHQRATPAALALRRRYPRIVIWWASRVEVCSALARLRRDAAIDSAAAANAVAKLDALARASIEVVPTEPVRTRAERLTTSRDVRAADALQLAAALDWCGGRPGGRAMVCFDARLAAAARAEGFAVYP